MIPLGTVCVAATGLFSGSGLIRIDVAARAAENTPPRRSEAPILRSETLGQQENRQRHMNRLYQHLDSDFVTTTLRPLFLDPTAQAEDMPPGALAMGTDIAREIESHSGREALVAIAERLDFDSAGGTFPTQDGLNDDRIMSVWIHGNRRDINNRITRDGFNPGLSGDVISIDTGVDYRPDDWSVFGISVGWGSTEGEMSSSQTLYEKNSVTFSPYAVTRVTDWLDLRGALGIGVSDIDRRSESGAYQSSNSSTTYSASVGFGAEQTLPVLPVTISLDGNLIEAQEYFAQYIDHRGQIVNGHLARTTLFDRKTEASYRFAIGGHTFVPFVGEKMTLSILNQGFDQDDTQRYFAGTRYHYDDWGLNASFRAYREFSPGTAPQEGMRGELGFLHTLPGDYGIIAPFASTERTDTKLRLGGGLDHRWADIAGSMRLEINQTLTFDQNTANPLTGTLKMNFDF